MKLINKSTGEIGKLHCDMNVSPAKYGVFEDTDIRGNYWEYDSLAELNSEWEDYTPKEPLIKDEKIRKAVRAWAEANEITQVSHDACWNAFRCSDFVIAFDYDFDRHDGFEDMKSYTIAELCGEEKECES